MRNLEIDGHALLINNVLSHWPIYMGDAAIVWGGNQVEHDQTLIKPGEAIVSLPQKFSFSDQRFAVCKCAGTAWPPNRQERSKLSEAWPKVNQAPDEYGYQIWAQSDRRFVWKFTETGRPRNGGNSAQCDQKIILASGCL